MPKIAILLVGISLVWSASAIAQDTTTPEYKETFNTDGSVTYETSKGSITFTSEELDSFSACATLDEEIAGHEVMIANADYSIAGMPQFVREQEEIIDRLREQQREYACSRTSRLQEIGLNPNDFF